MKKPLGFVSLMILTGTFVFNPAASAGEPVRDETARIMTHDESWAIVTLPDHSQFKLDAKSEVALDSISQGPPKSGEPDT